MNIKNLGAQQAHQLNECISEKSDELSPLPNHTSSEESYYQKEFNKQATDIIKNQRSLSVIKTSTNETVVTKKM